MTKWGDDAVEKVARAYDPEGWEWYDRADIVMYAEACRIFRADQIKRTRAAIIATLDFLATPSEAMRGAAKFSESQIPLGNGTSVTVAGGLGDLPFDYWRMLDAAKREIEGT